MWGAAISAILGLIEWWTGKKKADAATAHDNQIRTAQQTTDALHGESDALKQVDRVNSSLDSGGVPIAADPNNRNR